MQIQLRLPCSLPIQRNSTSMSSLPCDEWVGVCLILIFNIECYRGLRSMIFYDELVMLECVSRHSLSCFFLLSESDNKPDHKESVNLLVPQRVGLWRQSLKCPGFKSHPGHMFFFVFSNLYIKRYRSYNYQVHVHLKIFLNSHDHEPSIILIASEREWKL